MYRQALLAAALVTGAAEPVTLDRTDRGHCAGFRRRPRRQRAGDRGEPAVDSRNAMQSWGRFRLADIPAGRYTIQVSAIGYGRREVTGVSVTAGGLARLHLTLKPSTADEVVAQTGVAKRAEADWR